MKNLCASAALIPIIIGITTPADAQILISGNVGSGGAAVFTIQSDLTFSINASGNAQNIVFDEWVTSDGGQTSTSFPSPAMSYVLNGNPNTGSFSLLFDNLTANVADLTANDGYLTFSPIPVVAGDTFTLKAGSWNFTGKSGFNPQTVQTFTGNVFLSDNTGHHVSAPLVAVPEPSEYGLMAGVGLLCWAVWRRKVRAIAAS